ncbi:MAG: BamA/TamA family outer membrane protein [FCB group bacterium]|nr:BamA/TamA family outer membrane protein [FCB group bacterium]
MTKPVTSRPNTAFGIPISLWLVLSILSGTFLSGLWAQQADVVYVRSIQFKGLQALTEDELRPYLKTRVAGIFQKKPFDRRMVRLDAISLKTIYLSRGYLEIVVLDSFHVEDNFADITFIIREGKQYFVRDVKVVGNHALSSEKIEALLGLKRGIPYNPVGAREYVTRVEEAYQQIHKLFNQVQVYDQVDDSVSVVVKVSEGPDVRIHHIFYEGLDNLDTNIVRRELVFQEGEYYQKDRIDRSRKRILETGIFSFVALTPILVANSDSLINILIELRRFKQREWISEGGYYPIPYYEGAEPIPGAGLEVEWKNRSLAGSTTNFSTKLTGHALVSGAKVRPKIRLEAGLNNQWFFFVRIPVQLKAYYESFKNYSQSGEPLILRYGVQLSTVKKFTNRSYIDYGLRWEKFIEPVETKSDVEQRTMHFKSRWDRTDDALYPTKGISALTDFNWTGGFLGGNQDFLKVDIGVNSYFPLSKSWVLAGRIKTGQIFGWNNNYTDIRFDKFYLGGANSLRGWDLLKLQVDEAGNPKGDVFRILTNWELRFPLTWLLGGELFLDGGYLANSIKGITLNRFKWNWGAGVTLNTPLGPLRLDVAIPDDRYQAYKVQLGVQYIF